MKTNIQIKLDEKVMNEFPWPKKDIPSFFYHYIEPEGFENPSYYNIKEISLIFGMVNRLVKAGVNPQNIGIITPYNSQKYRLIDKFDEKKYEDLRIESVDGFHGIEKDYIIISTVRSNVSGNIGFLTSAKRLNVALTRAKYGTIILGNAECLSEYC
jgi:regulator of nonsense transcripts 1